MPKGLSFVEFSRLLEKCPLAPGETLGVGVSGGPDSMALLALLSKCLPKRVRAILIDHKIRSESTEEATKVKNLIESQGIPCSVYTADWGSAPPLTLSSSKIEELAREHRYRLFSKACHEWNIEKLFLGHHLNDLNETIFFRLARGSGLNGLSPMSFRSYFPFPESPSDFNLQIYRPLLSISKKTLLHTCEELGIQYIQDPMNEDLRFQRNLIRSLLAKPPHPYFTEENFNQCMKYLYDYGKESFEQTKKIVLENIITDPQSGTLFISVPTLTTNRDHWMHQGPIANSVLTAALRWVMCKGYPPPISSIEILRKFMCNYVPQKKETKPHNVYNALVFPPRPMQNGPNYWIFLRSPPMKKDRMDATVALRHVNDTVLFENRYYVTRTEPPVKHSSLHLNLFYLNLKNYLPLSSFQLDSTHELIVRHFHEHDVFSLNHLLSGRQTHSAWIEYNRAYEHFKFKMPVQGRFSILVLAVREKGMKYTNVLTNKEHELRFLGQLVAIPCLGMNFLPSHVGFKVEYRQPITRILASEADNTSFKLSNF